MAGMLSSWWSGKPSEDAEKGEKERRHRKIVNQWTGLQGLGVRTRNVFDDVTFISDVIVYNC